MRIPQVNVISSEDDALQARFLCSTCALASYMHLSPRVFFCIGALVAA